MMNRTGPFVLGLALIAATTSAEIVEEERFDLVAQSEMSASDEPDLNTFPLEWEWVSVYHENPPLLIAAFEGDVDDIQPSALPSEAMIDDSLSVLPFPEEDRLATEQQQHQAP
jgi:hypothetical protein